ncbi:RNA-binding protein 33 [Pimephales promelas]|uniref:RNA-binding protein 33 n=1 Tax=Pimephales promelas TaxID=90988 RepID=UPI0019557A2D|nr:RNA-binding protein 33 [Pimephales promelas]KAG1969858.1 hypothetical protein F2P79_001700 [Pimephales promelas]KAG1969861.1 hypothetical protein F2P79_001700 [Pimephales promelas]KAG1969863.1 hypothetical protein F2P79_001700 [Pimephales promelas]KAG1969864.1 hypothetical protein F2P79_001700 [Pimephales promelas]
MNSDSEEGFLVDDWLTSKQGLLDTSDEELNDDLLRSDDENETMRCHDESFSKPKVQAIAKPYLVCETPHLAEDQTICPKEEQTEVDPGEVLDIEINAPSGDEFQVAPDLREGLSPQPSGHNLKYSCKGQPAPEETLTRPCRRPEPVFPGQHMFDQQHSASVLDTNPLLAGPAPMGSIHPPGYESDPWRPSPALQGLTDLSKSGSPHRGHYSLPKNRSVLSGCPFSAPSGPQAQKPAVLVRAVARMVQSAKPMAVARGMPIAARQPASAKSKISAKTPPAPGMVGRNVGQKVKVKPQTPPAIQKCPAKLLNMTNNKEHDEVLYRQRLKKQKRLREQVIKHKEWMRSIRAINNRRLLLESFQTNSSTGHWNNYQNQQKQPCIMNSCPQKVSHQQPFHHRPRCLVPKHQPESQSLPPQQHQYHLLALQPPWQRAPPAPGNPPGCAAEVLHNQPHQHGTDRVMLQGMEQIPNQMNQQYSNDEAHAADPQVVRQRGMRILEQRTSEGPVSTNITVVKHFSPGMSEDTKAVTETKGRIVTFSMPDSSPPSILQHGLKLNHPNEKRGSGPNQPHDKVAVGGNERSAFIPLSSGVRTEPVTDQTCVNFIVRLNR